MEGAWGGAWGPPVSTRVASVEGQAQVKTSAWGKPLPAAGQPQPHLQASPQAQPVGGVAGLGAGVPVDPLPVRARLDQAPVGRGLPPASPQQSATSSVVASPLSVPSVPSGPLPGVLSMGIGTSGGMNAGKVVAAVALAGSSATSEGRHVVRCKGLPFSATATSVASFFEPLVRVPACFFDEQTANSPLCVVQIIADHPARLRVCTGNRRGRSEPSA